MAIVPVVGGFHIHYQPSVEADEENTWVMEQAREVKQAAEIILGVLQRKGHGTYVNR